MVSSAPSASSQTRPAARSPGRRAPPVVVGPAAKKNNQPFEAHPRLGWPPVGVTFSDPASSAARPWARSTIASPSDPGTARVVYTASQRPPGSNAPSPKQQPAQETPARAPDQQTR